MLVTENAFKGYTFQQSTYCLFTAILDTDNKMKYINAEIKNKALENIKNFDDLWVRYDNLEYYIQVKNFSKLEETEIVINDDNILLGKSTSMLNTCCNNVVVLYNCDITVNDELFGIPSFRKDNVQIISLNKKCISDLINSRYKFDLKRAIKIILFAQDRIHSANFKIEKKELPSISVFKQKLNEDTIYLRDKIDTIEGVLLIEGKPGVGKSHYVEELSKTVGKNIVYRFWIGSQDENYLSRLDYDIFLRELRYLLFNEYSICTESELIDKLLRDNVILLIDGLDHVENYNPKHIDLFISFFNRLKKVKCLLFSRPLLRSLSFQKHEISNWNYIQTFEYLEKRHKISDVEIKQQIYNISDGYPIISNFLSCHYIVHGKLEAIEKISDIYDYYNELIDSKNDSVKCGLSLFALSRGYFSIQDIKFLVPDVFSQELFFEFINRHLYLFEKRFNRYSLIHDSLNNFLRINDYLTSEVKDCFISKILLSIKENELRFLNRFNLIDLPIENKIDILREFTSIKKFNYLLENNWDIDAIKEFYYQLDAFLETQDPSVIDIYQYYELALIKLCCDRIDTNLNFPLLFQQIKYIFHFENKKLLDIYSNSTAFEFISLVFQESKIDKVVTVKENFFYNDDNSNAVKFLKAYNDNSEYFEKLKIDINWIEIIPILSATGKYQNKYCNDVLADMLVNEFICGKDSYGLVAMLNEYIYELDNDSIFQKANRLLSELNLTKYADNPDIIFHYAKFKLFSLGYYDDINPYKQSLQSALSDNLLECKEATADFFENQIRLKIYQNETIDIENVWKAYTSFCYEKDDSIIKIPKVLSIFEKKLSIDPLLIINKLRKMEKSVSNINLLERYFNAKGIECLIILEEIILNNEAFNLNLFELNSEILNLLPENIIGNELNKYCTNRYFSNVIEEYLLYNILESKHCDFVKNYIEQLDFKIMSLSKNNSNYETFYIKKGMLITEEDLRYAIDNRFSPAEIASYPNGYYLCFTDLSVYKHFDKDILKQTFLEILHAAMKFRQHTLTKSSYFYFISNVPHFADLIDYDVDWKKLLNALIIFAEILSIDLEIIS